MIKEMTKKKVDETKDTSPSYWSEYSNLQKVKHDLIRNYLGGWFPKLGFWSGRVIYIDTHAGRGIHTTGELGSPLVALNTLLNHRHAASLLQKCETSFYFTERDTSNLEQLKQEVNKLGNLPKNVAVHMNSDCCYKSLEESIKYLRQSGKKMAPAFVFLDPYGFKVPGKLVRELMSFERVELFINVIWRELDMAMQQGDRMKATLDPIFDGLDWQQKVSSANFDERAAQTVDLFRELAGAKWATHIRMLGENGATRYLLAHLTNHDSGRDLMKDCIWKVCPDGGFYARKADDYRQEILITPTPDMRPLQSWILEQLKPGPARWNELTNKVRREIWRDTHLNKALLDLKKSGLITGTDFSGRFGPGANPLLGLVTK